MILNNFTVIDSIYGRFILNRHCAFQAESLIKTGKPHIQGELDQILRIAGSLPRQCVCVDAGANIGLVAIPLAQAIASRSGVVHAFEVQRMMCYALGGSAVLNDLENLYANHVGLGARNEWREIGLPNYAVPQDFGLFSLQQTFDNPVYSVEIRTIDSLNLPRLDFLKIDVEGMELDVLDGAEKTIRAYRPWAWIEHWKAGPDNIRERFPDMGYRFFMMDQLNMLCAPEERMVEQNIDVVP